MNTDIITKLGNSLIHHGKNNNRIYLMKLEKDDFPQIIDALSLLAKTHQYTKIIAKIPKWAKDEFIKNGYKVEAVVPNFYNGQMSSYFLALYLDPQRAVEKDIQKTKDILMYTKNISNTMCVTDLPSDFKCNILNKKDATNASVIYKKVFSTYPFPIFSPAYLMQTMDENIVYFGVWHNDKLVAVSSCEMDLNQQNVEMTDFATLPEYTGKGLASYLLCQMQAEMKTRGVRTAYTIARATSYGMNITFAKQGYKFGGTLINNTDIFGAIESMNVWYFNF